MGRTMGFPPSYATIYTMLNGLTAGNLCYGPFVNLGIAYNFVAEGDDYGWRSLFAGYLAPISPYVTFVYMAPFTSLSKVMEYTGIGGVDALGIFTHGGFGTVYPVNGVNFTGSVETATYDSLFDGATMNTAFWFGYGPLQLRSGSMHYPMHYLPSYAAGIPTLLPQIQVMGKMQYLYKGPDGSPAESCETIVRGPEQGSMPAFAAVQTVEAHQSSGKDPVSKSDIIYSFAYYPRVTCCNYCAGSKEAPWKLYLVGQGFWTQLDL